MAERRAFPRVKGPFEGWWDGASRQDGRIVDLSLGGCFIESMEQPSSGEVVMISIAIQSGQINLPGEVLYTEPHHGFAVRFVDIPDGVMALLRREVERNSAGSDRS